MSPRPWLSKIEQLLRRLGTGVYLWAAIVAGLLAVNLWLAFGLPEKQPVETVSRVSSPWETPNAPPEHARAAAMSSGRALYLRQQVLAARSDGQGNETVRRRH